jgi:hypothetical protein
MPEVQRQKGETTGFFFSNRDIQEELAKLTKSIQDIIIDRAKQRL